MKIRNVYKLNARRIVILAMNDATYKLVTKSWFMDDFTK